MNTYDAVTVLFARMACRKAEPCKTCLDFCRDSITPRARPIVENALRAAALTGNVETGLATLLLESAAAGPLPDPLLPPGSVRP